ncbi:unnamed protein product [Allacma fusca]|uniref:LysM domain-containing protein n=1 Tax=Allacma fusca TaxID=39272 RepID=A0A8J2LQX6_9HEXA|nr:unnamed protein product [Allacma fusca]
MATKRGEQSRLELTDFYSKKENDYIEKHVLPTDTLQGIALQYNTTVADLKKLNNLHTDAALHAHRTIKVPARGILINLEPDTVPILLPVTTTEEEEEVETNGQTYLNNIDETLNEIREKAKNATANSVVASMDSPLTIPPSRNQSELKWWKVFLPCLGTLIVFPILYFFYRQHLPSGNEIGCDHTWEGKIFGFSIICKSQLMEDTFKSTAGDAVLSYYANGMCVCLDTNAVYEVQGKISPVTSNCFEMNFLNVLRATARLIV